MIQLKTLGEKSPHNSSVLSKRIYTDMTINNVECADLCTQVSGSETLKSRAEPWESGIHIFKSIEVLLTQVVLLTAGRQTAGNRPPPPPAGEAQHVGSLRIQ